MNWISRFDMRMLLDLVASRSESLTHAMILVSNVGEWTLILIVSFIVATGLYIKRLREEAVGLLVATVGGAAGAYVIKELIARPRPDIAYRAVAETGYSFPSAHAVLAVAFFGFLAYLIARENKRLALVPIAVATLACLIIGFSRIYLGVHYFSDVVGGYVVGALFLWLGITVEQWLTRRATFSK